MRGRSEVALLWVLVVLVAASSSSAFRVVGTSATPRTRRRTRCAAAEGDFAVGAAVKVVAEDITLWHHPKSKKTGLNPKGLVGKVARVATVPRDGSETPISANYELCVTFTDPRLLAHFRPDELELLDDRSSAADDEPPPS